MAVTKLNKPLLEAIDEAKRQARVRETDTYVDLTSDLLKLDKAEEAAKSLAEQGASRAEWLQLADIVGRSLAKFGAAKAGAKAGVAVADTISAKGPIDWEASARSSREFGDKELSRLGGLRKEALGVYGKKLQEIGEERRDVIGGAEKAASLEREEQAGRVINPYREADDEEHRGQPLMLTPAGDYILPDKTIYVGPMRQTLTGAERVNKPGVGTGVSIGETALSREETKALTKARDVFDTETKDVKKSLDDFNIAKDQVTKAAAGNPSALQFMGSYLARAIQGGRLTDKDVTLYISRPDTLGWLGNNWDKVSEGKLPADSAAYLQDILNGITKANTRVMEDRAEQQASRFTTDFKSRGFQVPDVASQIYSKYKQQPAVSVGGAGAPKQSAPVLGEKRRDPKGVLRVRTERGWEVAPEGSK